MTTRRTTGSRGRTRAATALGLATALGAVAAADLGPGIAAAEPVTVTLAYTCRPPEVGPKSVSLTIAVDLPGSHTVGVYTPKFPIDVVATVEDPTVAQALGLAGVKSVDGTADAAVDVIAPQGTSSLSVPFQIARTEIPASGQFDVEATGTAPSLLFSQPGTGKITIGNLAVHAVPRDANGNPILGTVDVPCQLDAGQNNVLATFDIVAPPGPTTPAPPQPTPSGQPGPTTPAPPGSTTLTAVGTEGGGPAPVGGNPTTGATASVTPAGTTASGTPGTALSTSTTGQASSTTATKTVHRSLGGPAVGALIALALAALVAAGVAVRIVSRRRARHSGG